MKHLTPFKEGNLIESAKSSYDKAADKLTANDEKYYEEFLKMTKKEISEVKKCFKDLFQKALDNMNEESHKDDKGTLFAMDTTSTDIIKYGKLSAEDLKAFIRCDRILDFNDGFKPKESKK